jgi:hypothetical protein
VITCTRCGRPNPLNAANCQNCGSPLTSNMSGGSGSSMTPRMIAPDQQQPELPAWLESLRSGERSGASSASPPDPEAGGFVASDLIDEGMLPSWMRPERKEMTDSAPLESYPPRRPASTPAPNTDNTFMPSRGMDASSLIDQQALPSWLQEKKAAPYQAQDNLSAASLVQADALPEWIRNAQPRSQTPTNAAPQVQPALPPQGIMGNDLIDRQEMPNWMSAQDTSSASRPQAGLSASSLLDANALPSWLRQTDQEQQRGNTGGVFPPPVQGGSAFASSMPQSGNQPASYPMGTYNQSSYMQKPTEQAPDRNTNLSAASFIEMDALPSWLRNSDDPRQQSASPGQQQGFADPSRQATFGVPARPENIRVPSRPRGEMPTHEDSEVAANVFASMLGVASAAPYFPEQQRDASWRSQGQSPTPPPYAQQNMAQPQGNNVAATPSAGLSSNDLLQVFGAPGVPQNQMGTPSLQDYQPQQGYGQAIPMNSNSTGFQSPQFGDHSSRQAKPQAKSEKRGFFSKFMDWLSR